MTLYINQSGPSGLQAKDLVLTQYGYKYVDELIYNDKLCTSNMLECISNIEKHKTTGLIMHYYINTFHMNNIIINPDHYLLAKCIKNFNIRTLSKETIISLPIVWVQAKDLNHQHLLAMPVNCKETTYYRHDEPIPLDNLSLWFLIGYFISYGKINSRRSADKNYNTIMLIINKHKKDELLPYFNKIVTILPACDNIPTINNKYCLQLIKVNNFLFDIFDEIKDNKTIPNWIQDAPLHLLHSFIHGMLYNNKIISELIPQSNIYCCTFKKDYIIIRNNLKELFLSVQLILLKCRYASTIINIDNIFSLKIFKPYTQNDITLKKNNHLYPCIHNQYAWVPILKKQVVYKPVDQGSLYQIKSSEHIIVNNLITKL